MPTPANLPGEIEKSTEQDSEEEVRKLVIQAKKGDQEAFRKLVEMYRTRVASIAYGLVGSYEDARDISQEVFIKVYRALHRFDANKKFFTWLYRLSINAAIDFLRANKKRSRDESIDSDQNYVQYPDQRRNKNIEQSVENTERQAILQR
ncbi:MAG: sigma-70 family RNA polymerase sigma factor, partial [bacterium]